MKNAREQKKKATIKGNKVLIDTVKSNLKFTTTTADIGDIKSLEIQILK